MLPGSGGIKDAREKRECIFTPDVCVCGRRCVCYLCLFIARNCAKMTWNVKKGARRINCGPGPFNISECRGIAINANAGAVSGVNGDSGSGGLLLAARLIC